MTLSMLLVLFLLQADSTREAKKKVVAVSNFTGLY